MKLNYKKIGEFINLVDKRNTDNELTKEDLKGIRIDKTFIPSVANVSGTDLSKYKIVEKNTFAYSSMQVGRDKTIRVVLYEEDRPAIISPAYLTFVISKPDEILPEYLMLNFLRPESDRYGWFISDGSVRASLEWDRFCDIEIPLPPIEIQRKITMLYRSMRDNHKLLKDSLLDLQKVTESYIDEIKKTKPYIRIGEYIKQSDKRNKNLNKILDVNAVKGISNNKKFIDTKANMKDVNLDNYKVVESSAFAFVTVTSRNGNKISIALNDGSPKLVSSTYIVFYISNQMELLPEFLFLWFNRPEFDRYTRYHSLGSAREVFGWDDMCDVRVPLPSIQEQRSIIEIHHVLLERKVLLEKLEQQIKNVAPILIREAAEKSIEITKELSV